MQTFMPLASFIDTAACLDQRRLGKQRIEGLQLLRTCFNRRQNLDIPWAMHPACKMWVGYEEALAAYTLTMCREWKRRSYLDTTTDEVLQFWQEQTGEDKVRTFGELRKTNDVPPWFGDVDFHESHMAALLRKDALFYWYKFKGAIPSCGVWAPYMWPELKNDGKDYVLVEGKAPRIPKKLRNLNPLEGGQRIVATPVEEDEFIRMDEEELPDGNRQPELPF